MRCRNLNLLHGHGCIGQWSPTLITLVNDTCIRLVGSHDIVLIVLLLLLLLLLRYGIGVRCHRCGVYIWNRPLRMM